MSNLKKSASSDKGFILNRRGFLIASSLGATGLIIPRIGLAGAQHRHPIYLAVTKLAQATGSRVAANLITEYIRKSYISYATYSEVNRTNRKMAQDPIGRFTDLSKSTVYLPETDYFFYPAISQDGFNTCAAFYDTSRSDGSQEISLIEGPTLFAIGLAAEELAEKDSTEYASEVFLPREKIRNGTGSWRTSYTNPDIYETDAGTVYANYSTDGRGRGEVRIEARNESGSLLSGGTYSLTYTT